MLKGPGEIEKRSFEIIQEELGHIIIDEKYASIIKRVIHTTADFEYARILEFHPESLKEGIESIKKGVRIYADTKMIIAGVNKSFLEKWGCAIYTYIDDPEVVLESKSKNLTRSVLGIEKAFHEGDTGIFVIGNSPTALFRLKELIEESQIKPVLIIGVPVGFVGAGESKAAVKTLGVPYIVTNGRKGGSPVAAAILNAILYGIG